jgi:hypothetical protein
MWKRLEQSKHHKLCGGINLLHVFSWQCYQWKFLGMCSQVLWWPTDPTSTKVSQMSVQYHLQKESDVVGWLLQTVCTGDVANISLKATRVQQWLGEISVHLFLRSPSYSLPRFKDQTKHDKIRTIVTWWRMHIVQKVLLGVGIRQLDGATYKCRLLVSLHWWSRIWGGFLGMFRSLGITYAVSVKREIRRGLYTNLSFYTA